MPRVPEWRSRRWSAASATLTAIACAVASALACACERERVDVADGDDASEIADGGADTAFPPTFPRLDAMLEADAPACSSGPLIGVCAPCARGYVIVNGEPTCDCCP